MTLPRFSFAVDHRIQLTDEAASRGRSVEDCRRFKRLCVEAFLRARRRSATVQLHGAMILDQELGDAALQLARRSGVPVGQPAEVSGQWPLRLLPDFRARVLGSRPAFIKCLVSGRPDMPRDAFASQNGTVQQLHSLCDRAGIPLVLELIVSARPEEDPLAFEATGRAALTARWMRQLRARGIRPAQWKLEGFGNVSSVQAVSEVCGGDEEIIFLGKSADPSTIDSWFEAAIGSPKVVGFAVGRTIFWEPFLEHLQGASEDLTVYRLAERYLDILARWEGRRSPP